MHQLAQKRHLLVCRLVPPHHRIKHHRGSHNGMRCHTRCTCHTKCASLRRADVLALRDSTKVVTRNETSLGGQRNKTERHATREATRERCAPCGQSSGRLTAGRRRRSTQHGGALVTTRVLSCPSCFQCSRGSESISFGIQRTLFHFVASADESLAHLPSLERLCTAGLGAT